MSPELDRRRPSIARITLETAARLTDLSRRAALIAVLAALVLASTLGPAVGQERVVRFEGRVQWIAGQLMAVQPDLGLSVSVDLVRVPQDQYARLRDGDRVGIIGVIRNGDRRVFGTSILRGGTEAP